MPKSTISRFNKNEKMTKAAYVAKGSKMIKKKPRSLIIEEIDKLLLVFINVRQLKGDSLSEAFICEKALDIHSDIVKKILGANSKDFDFKVGRGWLKKDKKEVEFTVYLDMERRQLLTRKRQRSL